MFWQYLYILSSGNLLIKFFFLFRFPKHIMITAKQNLTSGKSLYEYKVLCTLLKISPPAVVSGYYYGIR